MSVFSKIKDFFSRHKTKFLVGGFLLSGSLILTKYAQQRLKHWQENETFAFLDKNKKKNHFESIQKTSDQTILNLATNLMEIVLKKADTDKIIEALKSNPENKLEMWNNLKVLVFIKTGLFIYSIVMLVITLKIQFNIVGGYLYRDPTSVTTEIQEKYLLIIQNFLNKGVDQLAKLIETEVDIIVKTLDFKKLLTLSDLETLLWTIQTSLASHDKNPIDNLKTFIIPSDVPQKNDIYHHLILDTADLLESEEVKSISSHCINRGFVLFSDQISEFFVSKEPKLVEVTNASCNLENSMYVTKPLAKLIPIINGLLTKERLFNQFVQLLLANDKLKILSANVYESLL
ncbi:unnamed protein product [Brassicogethes aeneus]|uniref:Peroxisomal biogenesis factor 3 n=1 Tax=Brassicogethes aeneus TaxID=1431903 RepID=A0A9P0BBW0_BRAAE|nr:unnamed protein product [Brassicogethes aeneus]